MAPCDDGHNFAVLREFWREPRNDGSSLTVEGVSVSVLFCSKCGETREIEVK